MLTAKLEAATSNGPIAETLAGADAALIEQKVDLIPSQKRRNGGFGYVALLKGFIYHVDYQREGTGGVRVYWKCTQRGGCGARIITNKDGLILNARNNYHTHEPLEEGNENKAVRSGRSRSFNYQTNLALIREISKRKQTIFGYNDALTPEENVIHREIAWEEIKSALTAQGHTKFSGKDWKLLRAHGWQQARQTALSKKFINLVPGAKHMPLDELDEIVLDIVGNETLCNTENLDDLSQIDMAKDDVDSNTVSTSPSLSNEPISALAILNSFVAGINDNAAENRNNRESVELIDNGQSESPQNPFEELYQNQQHSIADANSPPTPTSQSDMERERARVQIAHERAKLILLEKQIAQEQELHQLKIEVEKANLRASRAKAQYEEKRLQLLQQDRI
ncbi:hypothetical protein M3Y94_00466100 [Aphelenchoides besseyi]|nr:hypothetical protein M3Y94_00466100 [Aphelenchoides besseyi]KAI6229166.1 hypothetical protein M3Y95_00502700 [Aphelenchoides besseyi]